MRLLALLPALLLLGSCNLINPEEPLPGYIHIEEFDVSFLPGQGTSSEKITEIWVYANEKIIGVYDLPADVPVLENGPVDFLFFAGIKNNGVSRTRIRYPFYKPHAERISIGPLSRDTVRPVFSYYNGVIISERDFEDGNFLIPAGSTQGQFVVTTDPAQVFEGARSGLGTLQAGESVLYFKDDDNWTLTGGEPIFIELNYSCNNTFAVGLIATRGSTIRKELALIINPTTGILGMPVWNKIYIDLGLIPLQNPNADFFEMYVEAVPDQPGKPVELFLDNIKLVRWI